jgi:hypothetical protein
MDSSPLSSSRTRCSCACRTVHELFGLPAIVAARVRALVPVHPKVSELLVRIGLDDKAWSSWPCPSGAALMMTGGAAVIGLDD